jgi:hypothetical protein
VVVDRSGREVAVGSLTELYHKLQAANRDRQAQETKADAAGSTTFTQQSTVSVLNLLYSTGDYEQDILFLYDMRKQCCGSETFCYGSRSDFLRVLDPDPTFKKGTDTDPVSDPTLIIYSSSRTVIVKVFKWYFKS